MKKSTNYILGLFGVFVLAYSVTIIYAERAQVKIHDKYGQNYNSTRLSEGIPIIDNFDFKELSFWKDFYPLDPTSRWRNILLNRGIGTSSYYYNPHKANAIYHRSKTIFYETKAFFWENENWGELDLFINSMDSNLTLELTIAHLIDSDEEWYFYTNIDTTNIAEPIIFKCGTERLETNRQIGNITKEQADNILTKWRNK